METGPTRFRGDSHLTRTPPREIPGSSVGRVDSTRLLVLSVDRSSVFAPGTIPGPTSDMDLLPHVPLTTRREDTPGPSRTASTHTPRPKFALGASQAVPTPMFMVRTTYPEWGRCPDSVDGSGRPRPRSENWLNVRVSTVIMVTNLLRPVDRKLHFTGGKSSDRG